MIGMKRIDFSCDHAMVSVPSSDCEGLNIRASDPVPHAGHGGNVRKDAGFSRPHAIACGRIEEARAPPFQEGGMLRLVRFKATDKVLFVICLMYLITYIDRVNIGTAAPAMQKELGLTNVELGLASRPSPILTPSSRSRAAGSATGWDRARRS